MSSFSNSSFEKNLWENKRTFDEILLRLMLFIDKIAPTKNGLNSMQFTVDVTESILQFTHFLKPELFHVHDIALNLNTNKIDNLLHIIEDKEFKICRSLYTVQPYFSLIFLLDKRNSKKIGFEIKDAIADWNVYVKGIVSIPVIDHYMAYIDLSAKPIIEINRESDFIKKTNPLIERLEDKLRKDVEKSFLRQFGVPYVQIFSFVETVRTGDSSEIRNYLELNLPDDVIKMDLTLRIIEYPDLEYINLEYTELHFNNRLLTRLLARKREDIFATIIKFNEMVKIVDLGLDYDSNKLLQKCLSA